MLENKMSHRATNSGWAFAEEVTTPNMRKSLLLNYSSSVVGHPVYKDYVFAKLDLQVPADFDALSEREKASIGKSDHFLRKRSRRRREWRPGDSPSAAW